MAGSYPPGWCRGVYVYADSCWGLGLGLGLGQYAGRCTMFLGPRVPLAPRSPAVALVGCWVCHSLSPSPPIPVCSPRSGQGFRRQGRADACPVLPSKMRPPSKELGLVAGLPSPAVPWDRSPTRSPGRVCAVEAGTDAMWALGPREQLSGPGSDPGFPPPHTRF